EVIDRIMTNFKPPKRYAPDIPFPSYSYVPGHSPHPTRDPQGPRYGEEYEDIVLVPAPDPAEWWQSKLYLYGIDLFNNGYYWETHEAWEDLWHALGRMGETATFFKAMIHLAAAGLKAKYGQWDAMRKHARRSATLLAEIQVQLPEGQAAYMGLEVPPLRAWAEAVADGEGMLIPHPEETDGPVFVFYLTPE
ncbi:MAG: DUF309 domain-containing protein, partial [bacterium]|nr:DUF309 domain-containing protein [bacterium]